MTWTTIMFSPHGQARMVSDSNTRDDAHEQGHLVNSINSVDHAASFGKDSRLARAFAEFASAEGSEEKKEEEDKTDLTPFFMTVEGDNGTMRPTLIVLDVSGSMRTMTTVGLPVFKALYTFLFAINPNTWNLYRIGLFGDRTRQAIDTFFTVSGFLEYVERMEKMRNTRVFWSTGTYTDLIVSHMDTMRTEFDDQTFDLVIIGDGGFSNWSSANVLVTSFPSFEVGEVKVLLCTNRIQYSYARVQQSISTSFADVLARMDTILSFEEFETANQLELLFDFPKIPGFYNPILGNGDALYISEDILTLPYAVFREGMENFPLAERVREATKKIARMFADNPAHASRVQENGVFIFWWKVLVKYFDDQYGYHYDDEMHQLRNVLTQLPALRDFFASSRETNLLKNLMENFINPLSNFMKEYEQKEDEKKFFFLKNDEYHFDGSVVDLLNASTQKSIGKLIAHFEFVSEMTNTDDGIFLLDVQTLEAMNQIKEYRPYVSQYISLIIGTILGLPLNQAVGGLSLFINVMVILSAENHYEDLCLKYNKEYNDFIRPLLVWFIEDSSHHKVDFDDNKNEMIQNMCSSAFFGMFFNEALETFPMICSDSFKEEWYKYQEAKALQLYISNGDVMNYQDEKWFLIPSFKNLVTSLQPFVEVYMRYTHTVSCPHSIKGNWWKFYTDGMNIYHKDIFKYLLQDYVGVFYDDDYEIGEGIHTVGLNGMCGNCGLPFNNSLTCCRHVRTEKGKIRQYNALCEEEEEKIQFTDWIDDMHSHSCEKFECPGCKKKFSSMEDRDLHVLNGDEETGCYGGQPLIDQEIISEAIKRLMSEVIPPIEGWMHSKSLEWVQVFEIIDMIKNTEPVTKMQIASMDRILQTGYNIADRIKFGTTTSEEIKLPSDFIHLDKKYLDFVLLQSKRWFRNEEKNKIRNAFYLKTCQACCSLVNLVDVPCGHLMCRECAPRYMEEHVSQEMGTDVLKKPPTCYCGACFPSSIMTSPFLSELVDTFSVDQINEMHREGVVGRCVDCRCIKVLQQRGGCGGDNTLKENRCGECILLGIELASLIHSDRNALKPTQCKGCGSYYDHSIEGYGGVACSHTTCSCGHEQCKCCGMVFVDSRGFTVNPLHYKFPTRVEHNGQTYWIYPECDHGDEHDF